MNEGGRPPRIRRRAGIFIASVAGLVALLVTGLMDGFLLADWRAELAAPPAASPAASPPPKPTAEASLDPLSEVPGRLLFVADRNTLRLLEAGVWTDIELSSPLHEGDQPYVMLSPDGERLSALIVDTPQVSLWSRDLASGVDSLVDLPYGPRRARPESRGGLFFWIDPARRAVFTHPDTDEMIMVDVDGRLDRLTLDGRQAAGFGLIDERSLVVALRRPDDPPTPTSEVLVWRPEGIEVLGRGLVLSASPFSLRGHPSGQVAVTVVLEDGEAILLLPEGTLLARATDFEERLDDPWKGAAISLRPGDWNVSGEFLVVEGRRTARIDDRQRTSMFVAVVGRDGDLAFFLDHFDRARVTDDDAIQWGAASVLWNHAGDALAISGTWWTVSGQSGGHLVSVVELDGSFRFSLSAPSETVAAGSFSLYRKFMSLRWGAQGTLVVSLAQEMGPGNRPQGEGRLVVFGPQGEILQEHSVDAGGLQVLPDGTWAAAYVRTPPGPRVMRFFSLLTGAWADVEGPLLRSWGR